MTEQELRKEQEQREEQEKNRNPETVPVVIQGPVLLREELEAQKTALEEERAAFERKKLEEQVARELKSRGLGAEFAPWLTGADEAESLDRVDRFERLFHGLLREELSRRLRGTEVPREPGRPQSYNRETLRQMSPREINAHWAEISSALRG